MKPSSLNDNINHDWFGLTFDDVLLIPQRSSVRSRRDVDLETRFTTWLNLNIPVIAANMDTVCESHMAIAMAKLGGAGVIHRFLSPEQQAEEVQITREELGDSMDRSLGGIPVVAAAIGTDRDMMERAYKCVYAGSNVLVLDVAHGHADHVISSVKELKNEFPDTELIAGNVATRAGAEDLAEAGADAVKVGVGPGGMCTTRLVAGSGVPQLSAIVECASVDVPIIADGGIRNSGDIVKALAAGADSVMLGSLLAGTKETPGATIDINGRLMKVARGMASEEASQDRNVDDEWYEHRAPEGIATHVPYRGEVAKVISTLMGGLRSGMSYSNASNISELWSNAKFVRLTQAGLQESGPHIHD